MIGVYSRGIFLIFTGAFNVIYNLSIIILCHCHFSATLQPVWFLDLSWLIVYFKQSFFIFFFVRVFRICFSYFLREKKIPSRPIYEKKPRQNYFWQNYFNSVSPSKSRHRDPWGHRRSNQRMNLIQTKSNSTDYPWCHTRNSIRPN